MRESREAFKVTLEKVEKLIAGISSNDFNRDDSLTKDEASTFKQHLKCCNLAMYLYFKKEKDLMLKYIFQNCFKSTM